MQMLVQIRMLLIWNHVLPLLLLLFVQWSRSDLHLHATGSRERVSATQVVVG